MSSECLSVTLKQITTLVEPLYPLPANFGKDGSLDPGFPFKYLSGYFDIMCYKKKATNFEKGTTLLWSTFVLYVPATSTEGGLRRTDWPLICFILSQLD